MNKTITSPSYKNKALSLGASFLAVASIVGSAHVADAATFNFSFSNVQGAVNGTVSGTIVLPDGNGTFAASAVTITSLPSGLGMTAPVNALASGSPQNLFSVVGGQIDKANTHFAGLINGSTALGLNTTLATGGSFLEALNTPNFGISGVRDASSSTVTFTAAAAAATPEPTTVLGLLAVGSLGVLTRKRKG